MPSKLSDAERLTIRRRHGEGAALRTIAAELGRSTSTISLAAAQLGLTFDRSQTAPATAAKVLDNRARRAALGSKLLDDAERLRGQIFAEHLVYAFGGQENVYREQHLPEPDPASKLKLVQACQVAITTSLRIDEADQGGADDGKSMLAQLGVGLRAAADALQTAAADSDGTPLPS